MRKIVSLCLFVSLTFILVGAKGDCSSGEITMEKSKLESVSNIKLPPLKLERSHHECVLLDDGRVLIVGGIYKLGIELRQVEVYNPDAQKFSSVGSMQYNRVYHTATKLDDGRVIVIGGKGTLLNEALPKEDLDTYEIFDPKTNAFSEPQKLPYPLLYHTVFKLNNGDLLIFGGFRKGEDSKSPNESTEILIYNPDRDQFAVWGKLQINRGFVKVTKLNAHQLIVTSTNSLNRSDAVELVDLNTKTTQIIAGDEIPREQATWPYKSEKTKGNVKLYRENAYLDRPIYDDFQYNIGENITLIIAGRRGFKVHRSSDGAYKLQEGELTDIFRRTKDMAVVALSSSEYLLIGGENLRMKSNPSNAVELFDTEAMNFKVVGKLLEHRHDHQAIKLKDGSILVTGGFNRKGNFVGYSELFLLP